MSLQQAQHNARGIALPLFAIFFLYIHLLFVQPFFIFTFNTYTQLILVNRKKNKWYMHGFILSLFCDETCDLGNLENAKIFSMFVYVYGEVGDSVHGGWITINKRIAGLITIFLPAQIYNTLSPSFSVE